MKIKKKTKYFITILSLSIVLLFQINIVNATPYEGYDVGQGYNYSPENADLVQSFVTRLIFFQENPGEPHYLNELKFTYLAALNPDRDHRVNYLLWGWLPLGHIDYYYYINSIKITVSLEHYFGGCGHYISEPYSGNSLEYGGSGVTANGDNRILGDTENNYIEALALWITSRLIGIIPYGIGAILGPTFSLVTTLTLGGGGYPLEDDFNQITTTNSRSWEFRPAHITLARALGLTVYVNTPENILPGFHDENYLDIHRLTITYTAVVEEFWHSVSWFTSDVGASFTTVSHQIVIEI